MQVGGLYLDQLRLVVRTLQALPPPGDDAVDRRADQPG
jgi:hypothetical protein